MRQEPKLTMTEYFGETASRVIADQDAAAQRRQEEAVAEAAKETAKLEE